MRTLLKGPITFGGASSASMASPVSSDSQQIVFGFGYSVTATYTGSPAGTIELQASNDNITFVRVKDSNFSISTAGSTLWNVTVAMYSYFKVVYTPDSGSGTLTAVATYKGD